ncbi:MAG: hypothetical protein LBQ18_05170 [Campylobacteraceae bacterium]|nr:hypothetical protein [Campylobacteraceae bacterium]
MLKLALNGCNSVHVGLGNGCKHSCALTLNAFLRDLAMMDAISKQNYFTNRQKGRMDERICRSSHIFSYRPNGSVDTKRCRGPSQSFRENPPRKASIMKIGGSPPAHFDRQTTPPYAGIQT